jgi:hypothetical protein
MSTGGVRFEATPTEALTKAPLISAANDFNWIGAVCRVGLNC